MIYVNSKLKYMFDQMPVKCVSDEESNEQIRVDLLMFHTFKNEELAGIPHGEWDVLYKDGDITNTILDNLELVIFKDDKFFKDNQALEAQMKAAKKEAEEKRQLASEAESSKFKDKLRIESLTKQVAYEQKRVAELNKELNKKEKEIRRLMSLLNTYNN